MEINDSFWRRGENLHVKQSSSRKIRLWDRDCRILTRIVRKPHQITSLQNSTNNNLEKIVTTKTASREQPKAGFHVMATIRKSLLRKCNAFTVELKPIEMAPKTVEEIYFLGCDVFCLTFDLLTSIHLETAKRSIWHNLPPFNCYTKTMICNVLARLYLGNPSATCFPLRQK